MQLPELPKKRKTKEADITPRVMKWLEKNWPRSAAVEIKVKGNNLLPHQKAALQKVSEGTFSWKIPDMGRRTPFDLFLLKDADALNIVCDGRYCDIHNLSTGDVKHVMV